MRKLISELTTQVLAIIILLLATAFWLNITHPGIIIAYCIAMLLFLVAVRGWRSSIFLSALILPIAITLPLIPHINVIPGVRALIASLLFGTSICIASIIYFFSSKNQ